MTAKSLGSSIKGHETHEGGAHHGSSTHDGNDGKAHHSMEPEHEKNIHSDNHGEHASEEATHDSTDEAAVTHFHDKESHSSGHQGEGHHPSLT
jgi:hypothetical protein